MSAQIFLARGQVSDGQKPMEGMRQTGTQKKGSQEYESRNGKVETEDAWLGLLYENMIRICCKRNAFENDMLLIMKTI